MLGFDPAAGAPEHGWLALRRERAELTLSGLNDHEGEVAPAFTGSLYIDVDDVDALWDTVRDHARICYTPATFDYGMGEFAVYDNNGYLLQFGTPSVGWRPGGIRTLRSARRANTPTFRYAVGAIL